jgi:hypothetical protein
MASFVLNQKVVTLSQTVDLPQIYTGSLGLTLSEVAPLSATTEFDFAIDVSAVIAFVLVSNKAATIKTNSSGSPANTLVLKAGVPYVWNIDSYDTFKFTTDITKIFVVIAGAADALIQMEAIVDATP